MRSKSLFAFVLGLALVVPARAQEKEEEKKEDNYWGSIFADFFLGPAKKDEFRWHGRIAPGATLEIKGVNGRVTAEAAAGNEIELVAEKSGRRQDPKAVEIEFAEHEGGLTVCAVYPSGDPSRKNECKPGRQGRIGARNSDVVVDFKLKVPAGVGLVARTVNGRVEVLGLSGNVEAYTVNGSVHLAADGYAQAETVNGSIRAELGKADWKDALAFKTVNGSVSVALPPTASTLVRVETVNGSIEADFAMNGAVKKTRRELSGTIGNGGRELRVNTVNGSVHLRKASS